MKKILLTIFCLLFYSNAYSAPDSSLSITPSAVDATTITASDENTRNNAISSWANSHDHNDIDQTANTLAIGDATAGNKTITANNADSSKPYIRYDDTNNRWVVSRDGSTVESVATVTGATLNTFILPQSPSNDDILRFWGGAWNTISKGTEGQVFSVINGHLGWATNSVKIGTFTRDQATASGTQEVGGIGFTARVILFFAIEPNIAGEMSLGWDDGTNAASFVDRNLQTTDTWALSSTKSIDLVGAAAEEYTGNVSAISSNSFTVNWTRSSTPTGVMTINYIAFR